MNKNKIIKALNKVIATLSFEEAFDKKHSSYSISGGGSWVFLGTPPEGMGEYIKIGGTRYNSYCYELNDKNRKEIARLLFTFLPSDKSIRFVLDTKKKSAEDLTPSKVRLDIEFPEEITVDVMFNAIKPHLDSIGKKLLSTRQKKFRGTF